MLNRTEAILFVDNVKLQFADDPDKYETFLDIMRDLKGNVISPSIVLREIATLFSDHPDLATEFNAFLPPGYGLHPKGGRILLRTPERKTVGLRDDDDAAAWQRR